ncbi:MAG: acyl carrier protein [Thermoguttaceae bacterium]|nr:acyl carrier protein [Thermoguttaceae bacterium]
MATKEEILADVQKLLAESLAVDEEEVTLDATLVDDLGAESIDLLEIVFSIEKNFNIKIDRSELVPEDLLSNTQYVVDSKLTQEGLEELQKRLPEANLEEFKKNPLVQNITKILTVNDLVNIVERKL